MGADNDGSPPPRLVKLRLPVALVRAMDEAIVTSRGGYSDRNDFVAEAIWDRLNEDATVDTQVKPSVRSVRSKSATALPRPESQSASAGTATSKVPNAPVEIDDEGGIPRSVAEGYLPLAEAVTGRGQTPTVPLTPANGVNFGLHNRDLPSLWVTTFLANEVRRMRTPVAWSSFTTSVRIQGQAVGEGLRSLDALLRMPVKVAVGFPKGGDKARASEDRFISTALGTPTREGTAGPGFLLGLIAADDPVATRPLLAPTPAALDLLAGLAEDGFGLRLPQPVAATRRWLAHIEAVNVAEHKAWMEILHAVADKPSRTELIGRFPVWTGSQADTNCMGFISRSREWGLVEPDLPDGRYRLTDLGEQIASDTQSIAGPPANLRGNP